MQEINMRFFLSILLTIVLHPALGEETPTLRGARVTRQPKDEKPVIAAEATFALTRAPKDEIAAEATFAPTQAPKDVIAAEATFAPTQYTIQAPNGPQSSYQSYGIMSIRFGPSVILPGMVVTPRNSVLLRSNNSPMN